MDDVDLIPSEIYDAYMSLERAKKTRVHDFILSLQENECSLQRSASSHEEALTANE